MLKDPSCVTSFQVFLQSLGGKNSFVGNFRFSSSFVCCFEWNLHSFGGRIGEAKEYK